METNYFEIAYEAIKRLGLRAVFLVGKNPRRIPSATMTDPSVHISNYEPFSKLFPRGAVIVHQCGIGTTGQALASGRPQILVPFAHDQPDNARRLVELGVGISIPACRLNVTRLTIALKTVTENEGFSQRAKNLVSDLQISGFDRRLQDAISECLGK